MNSVIKSVCFLSGAAALVFEVLWFRLAGLALGNSVWAVAVVLAGFMGGLALGGMLLAIGSPWITRPARFYAGAEIVIGLLGASLVLLLPTTQDWLAPLFRRVLHQPWLLNGARLAVAFVLLLLPSTAMGMSLPLLVKTFDHGQGRFAVVLGSCYAWNTIGAVAGTLATELCLIKWMGLPGAGVVAAICNFSAAVLTLRLNGAAQPAPRHPSPGRELGETGGRQSFSRVGDWRLLAAAYLSGAAILALEVVWFRFLQLFFVGTSTVFAYMLAIVLVGISSGGWLASRLSHHLPGMQAMIRYLPLTAGISVVLAYAGSIWVHKLCNPVLSASTFSLLLQAGFLMAPVSTISGLLFTMLGHAIEEEVQEGGRSAGLLTAANTVGALSGSVVAGFLLLSHLGMELSFMLMALVYGVIAFLLPAQSRPADRPMSRLRWAGPAVVLLYLAGILAFPFGMMSQTYFNMVGRKLPGATRVLVSEGLTETALYFQHNTMGKPFYHRLVTDSYSMSSTDPRSKRYMKLFVYLPVALHPDPKNALLLCFGVGSTAKALTDTKSLKSIDIVDSSQNILDLSSVVFPTAKANPLSDNRVRVHVEDGRFFLQSTDQRFDLITAEPPPPKVAGVVNLYSQEFFELARDRLAEGGILTYWLPVYQLEEKETGCIVKAFLNAFPDASLWEGGGLNWILMGTRNAAGPGSEERFSQQWADPVIGPEMALLGLESPEQLGAIFLADAPCLKTLTAGSSPLRDLFPQRISTDVTRRSPGSALYRWMMDSQAARARFEQSQWVTGLWPALLRPNTARQFQYRHMIDYCLYPDYRPSEEVVDRDLRQVLAETELKTLPLWLLGTSPQEVKIASELNAAGQGGEEVAYHLAAQALVERDYAKACRILEQNPIDPLSQRAWKKQRLYLLAKSMAGHGHP